MAIKNLTYTMQKTTAFMGWKDPISGKLKDKITKALVKSEGNKDAAIKKKDGENPLDKENTTQEYVVFIPQIIKSQSNLEEATNKVANEVFVNKSLSGAGKALDKFAENVKKISKQVSPFTSDGFKKNLTAELGAGSLYISLPMKGTVPLNLQHKYNLNSTVQFEGDNLISGAVGAAANSALKVVADKLSATTRTVMNQVGVSAYTPKRAFYEGTDPLTLAFSWVMTPRNQTEAIMIKDILNAFKFLSTMGNTTDRNNSTQSIFLQKNPAVWRIDFPNGDAMEDMIVKDNSYNLMVCTGFKADYGDGAFWTPFKDGFPNSIKLDLSFTQMFPFQSREEQFGEGSFDSIFKDDKLNPLEDFGVF